MKLNLIINHTSMEPIYEQIMAQIKAEVIEGTLTAGDALPSVRALSRELKISALTSKKSLRQSGSRRTGRDCPWQGKILSRIPIRNF